jgi:hypothetical protein
LGTEFDTFPLSVQLSVLKYLIRMSTRCTPFGLFAGCGTGSFDEKNHFPVVGLENFESHTRFDMNLLGALVQKLNAQEELKPIIRYFSNNSLYRSGNEYRYIEYVYNKGRRKYFLSSVEHNSYLEAALGMVESGKTVMEIASALQDDDNSIEDAKDFLNTLIENQILTSELEPTVIGEDVMDQILAFLKQMGTDENLQRFLSDLKKQLSIIDEHAIGRPVGNYQAIEEKIKVFQVGYEKKYLFQTDVRVNLPGVTVDSAVAELALEGLGVLNRLSPYREHQTLKKFRDDLYQRYENEEVPLVEALDADLGVGFNNLIQGGGDINPLVDDMALLNKNETSGSAPSEIDIFLREKYAAFREQTLTEVILTDEELKRFPETWNNLPATLSSMVEVLSAKNGQDGYAIRMSSAAGSSAANLLGRFCHLDPQIAHMVEGIVNKEEELLGGDAILAEIIHLPEARTGNVLYRPQLRRYEIPFLARQSVSPDFAIPISDLMISSKYGKTLTLRSKKLNRQIIPRLTNAHNFSNNALPIYHFLSLYQQNGIRPAVYFHWGSLLNGKKYLPRVKYKNIVLAPAIWNFTAADTKGMPELTAPGFAEYADNFCRQHKLADKIFLVQGDNKLFIDFKDPLSVKLLFSEIKNKSAQLEEHLFDHGEPLIKGQEGAYNNQIILNFFKNSF